MSKLRYLCKGCGSRFQSRRIEPRCPRCNNRDATKFEVLDPPARAKSLQEKP